MTIAVAFTCTDGAVVASDSMGASGRHATRVQKIHRLNTSSILWVTSGTEYLTQTIRETIQKVDKPKTSSPRELAGEIDQGIREALQLPLSPSRAEDQHTVESLVVGWQNSKPSVLHIPSDLAVVECRDKGFVAIGSAHDYAHVAAATLGHHMDAPLTVERAQLLAYRIVEVVCGTSSWGVGPPVQMGIVSDSGAHVLDEEELEGVGLSVERWAALEAGQFATDTTRDASDGSMPRLASKSQKTPPRDSSSH